ncbi:MAG: aminoacyl-tRNA hydrolase [Gemmatimonadaceae bacterium]|nr:aminoacyl-tRNA hydrolase [Gemmatimonadaceae bacterium]
MKVILGLGNPGREYEATRHNVGWWVVDHVADVWRFDRWKRDGDADVSSGMVGRTRVKLVKPRTYMNLSGVAMRAYVRKPGWDASKDLLVVVDEVALQVGRYRIRARGSAGGHNGLKSVEGALESREYARLRIGVGPSPERVGIYRDLASFVLAPFARDEGDMIVELLPRLTEAVGMWVREGTDATMNVHNREAKS